MEEQTQKQESTQKEIDYLGATVGDNEGFPGLEPKDVVIGTVTLKTKNKKDEVMPNPLVQVHCKHPDSDELVVLTDIKRLDGNNVIVSALFTQVDKEGKYTKDSAIAGLLSFMKVATLKELEGKTIGTVTKDEHSKYLSLKCYA